MNPVPPEESEEGFLARYEGKWFQPEIKKLIRTEICLDEHVGFNGDRMPLWAVKMFGKISEIFGQKPSSPEMTDDKKFGNLLGGKVASALVTLGFLKRLVTASEAERLKLAALYNSFRRILQPFSDREKMRDLSVHNILSELRNLKPLADRILAIRKKALSKIQCKSLNSQGRFFEGYGEGLLVYQRMNDWAKNAPKRQQKTAYIRAFTFMNWQRIEECSQNGKWDDLLQEFTRSLPDGEEISEEAFQKCLRRAGLGSFGKPGRRRETRTTR